jgi:hypothetical protein
MAGAVAWKGFLPVAGPCFDTKCEARYCKGVLPLWASLDAYGLIENSQCNNRTKNMRGEMPGFMIWRP